jgi:hypothetical protein
MAWEWRRNDRAMVLECLQQGEYDAIATTSQGALDELAHLTAALGVWDALAVIQVHREREGIPDDLLLRTLTVLPFIEAVGLSAAAETLFQDAAILLQLGYSIFQIQQGFNERHHANAPTKTEQSCPCHPDVLRQELARIDLASLHAFRKASVRPLFERRLVRGKTYAIDGSGIGDRWRVVGILNVNPERALWVTWRVLSGSASEKGKEASVVREMVDEVREIGGADAIEWLLMDALYADGPLLAWLKVQRQIDALVRLPEDRELYEDLAGLIRLQPKRWQTHTDVRYLAGHKQTREVAVAAESDLSSWDSFVEAASGAGAPTAKLWGCLIRAVDVETQETEEWALVSTRPFSTGWQGYTFWRQRWHIENNGFREFKEGWHVEQAPWTYANDAVVWGRVTFTCIAFNVAQIAKTTQGRRLAHLGIRRLRRELTRQVGAAPVIVFARDCYGVFDIEEIVTALGAPPAFSLRRGHAALSNPHRAPP